jgi:HlyD family secretion protein
LVNAERTIKELELSLADMKAGADEFDIRAKKIVIQQKEDALLDAKQTLSDHYIRAPFGGVVADVGVKKGDTVSSGTVVATVISDQRLAEVSLNEVDAAGVSVGQKVVFSFDAVEGLSLTGKVAEVDTLGTVTQGVVTYNIKIAFDTQDDRVKPGMSVSANIITDVRPDVLTVSNSAVKIQDGAKYVELFESLPEGITEEQAAQGTVLAVSPLIKQAETGVSNDTKTEITSGVKEGSWVISRTISSNSNTAVPNTGTRAIFGGPR